MVCDMQQPHFWKCSDTHWVWNNCRCYTTFSTLHSINIFPTINIVFFYLNRLLIIKNANKDTTKGIKTVRRRKNRKKNNIPEGKTAKISTIVFKE